MLILTPSPLQLNRDRWFDEMREEVERFWEKPIRFGGTERGASQGAGWAPPVDVFREGGDLVVQVDLPGVRREDVALRIEDQDFVIEGRRRNEAESREGLVYRVERVAGPFLRRFVLPLPVRADLPIEFKLADGVLVARLPVAGTAGVGPSQPAG